MGGIGWQTTRFYGYTPTSNCVYFGACYQSSKHFLVDLGAGVRYYFWGHVFVRPEVRYYKVFNNDCGLHFRQPCPCRSFHRIHYRSRLKLPLNFGSRRENGLR